MRNKEATGTADMARQLDKPSVSQHLCVQCGIVTATQQRFCSRCGAKMDMDADATIRFSAQKIELPAPSDDATVRFSSRTSPRLNSEASSSTQSAPQQVLQTKKFSAKKFFVQIGCVIGLVLALGLLINGVYNTTNPGSDAQVLRQATQSKVRLDTLLRQAQTVGVPASSLQPVVQQEQALDDSHAPISLLSRQPITEYYQGLARRYQSLSFQVTKVMTTATEQFQGQAQRDMQNFQTALSGGNAQSVGNSSYFSQKFSQDQVLLSSAHTPAEYHAISNDARNALQTLSIMNAASTQLADLNETITKMRNAHLDVTAIQAQYQNDVQLFNDATQPGDFQNLSAQMNAQYQQVVVTSIQAFPYISITKLNELETQIHLLKQYGKETMPYQKRLNADQVAVESAKTVYDDLVFFKQIDTDIASMHSDLVRGEANYLLKQFHQEVETWGKVHAYHDAYDGHDYALDNGYMNAGIGAALDGDLSSAATDADFQTVVAETNNALFNLHLFERDFGDRTALNQVHATDLQMLKHYKLQGKQVLLVSLAEQAMRVYQSGALVNAYHVTTGRQELPSLPGVWSVLDRRSPVIFKAAEPKGSPYWFPDTPISYAILYHFGGYFVHDAPWRADFGPGTQFPHQDASGTTAYNFDGSHGCINLQESDAKWVYTHTGWDTVIVIY